MLVYIAEAVMQNKFVVIYTEKLYYTTLDIFIDLLLIFWTKKSE